MKHQMGIKIEGKRRQYIQRTCCCQRKGRRKVRSRHRWDLYNIAHIVTDRVNSKNTSSQNAPKRAFIAATKLKESESFLPPYTSRMAALERSLCSSLSLSLSYCTAACSFKVYLSVRPCVPLYEKVLWSIIGNNKCLYCIWSLTQFHYSRSSST